MAHRRASLGLDRRGHAAQGFKAKGFGLGSQISWQALATYSYQFGSTGKVAWSGAIGYRALYVDYVQGSGSTLFQTNMLQHGPLIGVSAKF